MDDVRPVHAAAAGGEAGEAGGEEEVLGTVEELAKKIDYPNLQAALIEDHLYKRCLMARQYGVGAAVVRPCDVDSALRFLSMGVVRVASTVGHPFGSSTSAVKVYECRDLLRRGVKQINAFANPGKLLSRQFQHQEVEFIQLADACIEAGAELKIVIDNRMLDEEMKIILCRMAKRVNAHWVTTTEPKDLELIVKHASGRVGVECGGVLTLEQARMALRSGCGRISSPDPEALFKAREAEIAAAKKAAEAAT